MPLLHPPAIAAAYRLYLPTDQAEFVGRGTDNAAWYNNNNRMDLKFRGWENFGGIHSSPLSILCHGTDNISVVALGRDNRPFYRFYSPNRYWTEWWHLGEPILKSRISIVACSGFRLDLFALGSDNQCYHWRRDDQMAQLENGTIDPFGSRDGWKPLGGNFITEITAISSKSDRIDIFGIGTNNQCYHNVSEGNYAPFSGWQTLGGSFLSPIAAAPLGDNVDNDVFFVLGISVDRQLCFMEWHKDRWRPDDLSWAHIGSEHRFTSMPAVVVSSAGIDVFAVDTDNFMMHIYISLNADRFRDEWKSEVLDNSRRFVSAPTVVQRTQETGRLNNVLVSVKRLPEFMVVALTTDNTPVTMSRTTPTTQEMSSLKWDTSMGGTFVAG